MMIKCPECGKEISDKAVSCPSCGYVLNGNAQSVEAEEKIKNKGGKKKDSKLSIFAALFAFFTWTWWIGLILAIVDFIKNKNDGKRHIGSGFAIVMSILIAIVSFFSDSNGESGEQSVETSTLVEEQVVEENAHAKEDTAVEEIVETNQYSYTEQETEILENHKDVISVDEMTEEEYKSNCKQIYYEDIKDKSGVEKGEYVKIEAFLQQVIQQNPYDATENDLWTENNLDLTYFEFGTLSKEFENNYGGENLLLFSKDNDIEPCLYKNGNYVMIYGKVIELKTNGWTGKSSIYVIPKYIEMK